MHSMTGPCVFSTVCFDFVLVSTRPFLDLFAVCRDVLLCLSPSRLCVARGRSPPSKLKARAMLKDVSPVTRRL